MSLVVFTALVGLVIAPVPVHPVLAFTAILCIAVGAVASGALNMAYEGDIDALISRPRPPPPQPADPAPPHHKRGGRRLRSHARFLLGVDAWHPRQLAGGPAAC